MSVLHALIVFVGTPLLILVAITLVVIAPSLARGPRYRVGQHWDAAPEWFGVVPAGVQSTQSDQLGQGGHPQRQLATGPTPQRLADDSEPQAMGGASARW